MKKVYRLLPLRVGTRAENDAQVQDYLFDIDEDFTNKEEYIRYAQKYTNQANKKFNRDYKWEELFGEPTWDGWMFDQETGEVIWVF